MTVNSEFGREFMETIGVRNLPTHTHIHTYIHTYVHKYTHTYIHTYIHNTYIHTYIHTWNPNRKTDV